MCYIWRHHYEPFRVGKRTRQGNQASACRFILVSETVFIMVKLNENIQPINIFDHDFL